MKPLDIKSTRPSREELSNALQLAEAGAGSRHVEGVMYRELLALQHGAEQLAHKWRTTRHVEDYDPFGDLPPRGHSDVGSIKEETCSRCADELDELIGGGR